jgi:hypothetical protein
LWQEVHSTDNAVLHLLSRECHQTIPLPEIAAGAKAVEEFLPELAPTLRSPAPRSRCLLLLEPSLPAPWLNLRWETLQLSGRPLSSQALVVRNAVWGLARRNVGNTIRFLDLFPPAEFSFVDRLQPWLRSGQLRSCRLAFLKEQMSAASELLIMAHGRANGLVDRDGRVFDLPVAYPMPERIWLLACNVEGAMDKLARRLLEQGCRSVIAATSDLSAPEMACLLEDFLAGRASEESISWLGRAERALSAMPNSRMLTIWGECDIDPTPCAQWNRLSWDNAHGDRRRPPLDDESTREEFLSAYQHAASPHAWPLTREWMWSPLLWLAEKHHHPAMQELSERIGDSRSPQAIRGLAAAARRVGNYVQMAKYLSLGLGIPDLPVKERAEILGALANLFIDLDLPESAATIIQRHEDCHLDDQKESFSAEFKRLDWAARMEARRGSLHIALDLMTTKRKRAPVDTGRELAWQLYLATWGMLAGQVSEDVSADFAAEVAKRLGSEAPENVGHGNETSAYLLRALAAYAWASRDSACLNSARIWLDHAEDRLTDDDPGPWAYTIAYLHLQGAAPRESLDRALSALERARYFLEAASISGFADRESKRRRLLVRFQQRRQYILAELSEATDFTETLTEVAAREKTESDADELPTSAARLGVMPL